MMRLSLSHMVTLEPLCILGKGKRVGLCQFACLTAVVLDMVADNRSTKLKILPRLQSAGYMHVAQDMGARRESNRYETCTKQAHTRNRHRHARKQGQLTVSGSHFSKNIMQDMCSRMRRESIKRGVLSPLPQHSQQLISSTLWQSHLSTTINWSLPSPPQYNPVQHHD
jgi:hypothetical protein